MPTSSCPGGLADSCGQLFPVAYTADVTKKSVFLQVEVTWTK